ncbi:MAG: DUF2065 domain-containing protein [Deltaproteobacteria bacterium]|nr:DUF2065 domain-containing protein [Deltaproteobacteria bacterium]
MKFFLSVLGMVMILEGLPYFTAQQGFIPMRAVFHHKVHKGHKENFHYNM